MLSKILNRIKNEKGSIVRAIRNMSVVAIGIALMRLSTLVISILVARYTDPVEFGQFTLFITLFVLGMEVPTALDGAFIRCANKPQSNDVSRVYWFLSLASKVILIVIVMSLIIFSLFVLTLEPVTEKIVLFGLLSGLLFCIYNTFVSRFQQLKQYSKYSLVRPVAHVALLVLSFSVLMFMNELTIHSVMYMYLIIGAVFSLLAIIYIVKNSDINLASLRKYFSEYYGIAIILLATSVITKLSAKMDVFILNNYFTYEQLADYGVALRVSLLISIMTGIISIILYPKAPEINKDRYLFKRYMGLSLVNAIPQTILGVILIGSIDPIITLFFGKEYSNDLSQQLSIIMIIMMLFVSYTVPFQALVQFGEYPKRAMNVSIVRSVVTVLLLITMIPVYGILGASYVLLFVSVIVFFVLMYLALSENNIIHSSMKI